MKKKVQYKLSKDIRNNEMIIKKNNIHHLFDLENVLVSFKSIFWQNILYLTNIYDI